jgi:hypothetical protein
MAKSLDTFQSEVGDSLSSGNSQPFRTRTRSLPPRSTKRFDDNIARKPHQHLPQDDDYGFGYNGTARTNPFGDSGAADIAMQMLGGGSFIDSYERHDSPHRRVETIRSFEQSVHVITDDTGEDFEAIHVDEANPFDHTEIGDPIYMPENRAIDVAHQVDDFVYQSRTNDDQDDDENDETDQRVDYSANFHDDLSAEHDKYSVHAEEMLADVMNIAATRLSAPQQTSSSSSYMDVANGMEEFLNLASSHLSGSAAVVKHTAETGQTSSTYSFDSMMDFAASQLATPRQNVKVSPSPDNISLQKQDKSENKSVASSPNNALSYRGTESASMQKYNQAKPRPPPIDTNLPPSPPKTKKIPKVTIEQSDCDSECSEWSEGFFVEPEEEVVFIDLETEEPHEEQLRRADDTRAMAQPSTVKTSGWLFPVRIDKTPVKDDSGFNPREASNRPANASPES